MTSEEGHIAKLAAKFDVTAAMTAFGICLADMTPEGLLYYGVESRPFLSAGQHGLPGRQAWHFLHLMGRLPRRHPGHDARVRPTGARARSRRWSTVTRFPAPTCGTC